MDGNRDFSIRQRGRLGEDYVCDYLKQRGCVIAERNYSSRYGEIDIIAENEARLIFVEVKTRTEGSVSGGFESVTRSKIKKLTLTVEDYLMKHPSEKQLRFDCAQVIVDKRTNALIKIDYIKNAVTQ